MKTPAFITKLLTDYFRWLAGGVAVVVVLAGYLTVIAPKLTEVQTSQVSRQKATAADLKVKQQRIIDLQVSNAKFNTVLPAERRQVIDDFIPSDSDFPGLLLTVKNIVAQSNLTLDAISIGQDGQTAVAAGAATAPTSASSGTAPTAQAATVSGVNVKTQDITITVSGGSSYDAFKVLLSNFESSRRLFDVVSVTFTNGTAAVGGTQTGGSSNTWGLVLRSYYLPSK